VTERAALRVGAVHLFVFCVSVAIAHTKKRDFLKKTKQFRDMVSINNQQEVLDGLFKESIPGPLKCKMAYIRHLENR